MILLMIFICKLKFLKITSEFKQRYLNIIYLILRNKKHLIQSNIIPRSKESIILTYNKYKI